MERVVESLYQCIPSTTMLQAGVGTLSPLVTHHRWDCSGCINIYHCLLLGMCHAAAQCIQHCSMASGWPQAGEPEWFLCACGKTISLFRTAIFTGEAHKVFACMWCRTQLLCGGHNPMQDPRRKETGGRGGGGLKQIPNSVVSHSQKMCSS